MGANDLMAKLLEKAATKPTYQRWLQAILLRQRLEAMQRNSWN